MSRRILLVTGGSRGIGRATAVLGAARGYDVCFSYASNAAAAEETTKAVRAAGARALAVQADLASSADVTKLFEACDAGLGRLDVLVNNAGIVDLAVRLDSMDAARIERMLAVNVTGPFLCAREAVLRMSTRHGGAGGAIVNVSSAASRIGSPNEWIDYAAAKGAIDTMTLGLSKEVATEGIRVNCVRPGLIDTEIHASGGQPDRVERMKGMIPIGRAGSAEEVAAAILWLASDEASYATGAILDVAGGR